MTESPVCIDEADSVLSAASRMEDLDVGALPICGEDHKLHGMLTDRDIVVKVLAKRLNPAKINAGQLAQGTPVIVHADDDVKTVLAAMKEHRVRRLPVIDHGQLVGMIAAADVARVLDHQQSGELLEALSS